MKQIIVLSVFLLSSFSAFSQVSNEGAEIDMYETALKLDNEQKAIVTGIIEKKSKNLILISEHRSINESEFRVKRRNIYKGAQQSIRLVLKEEQLPLWNELIARQRSETAKYLSIFSQLQENFES